MELDFAEGRMLERQSGDMQMLHDATRFCDSVTCNLVRFLNLSLKLRVRTRLWEVCAGDFEMCHGRAMCGMWCFQVCFETLTTYLISKAKHGSSISYQ